MQKKLAIVLVALLVTLTAYATVTTIVFDAASDTAIGSYTGGGSSWAYVTGTGSDMTVSGANDNVQCIGFSGAEKRVRYTGTGTTIGDQDVRADVQVKNFNSGGVVARCSAVADTCYQAWIDTNQTNEIRFDKVVAGVPTNLGSWDDGVVANSTTTLRLRVTSSGGWEVQAGVGTTHTGTDASSPLTSGHPGMYCSTDENFVTLDNFVLDDLAGGSTGIILKRRKH